MHICIERLQPDAIITFTGIETCKVEESRRKGRLIIIP